MSLRRKKREEYWEKKLKKDRPSTFGSLPKAERKKKAKQAVRDESRGRKLRGAKPR